jgi:hypothetical protein
VLEDGQTITRTPAGYLLGVRTVQLGGAYVARCNPVREFYAYCTASPCHATLRQHCRERVGVLRLRVSVITLATTFITPEIQGRDLTRIQGALVDTRAGVAVER